MYIVSGFRIWVVLLVILCLVISLVVCARLCGSTGGIAHRVYPRSVPVLVCLLPWGWLLVGYAFFGLWGLAVGALIAIFAALVLLPYINSL